MQKNLPVAIVNFWKGTHTYDTAGSIIPYGIANDSNDYHVYDVLEGPNPNFDYSRRLTENRVYGEIENLRFEEDELHI